VHADAYFMFETLNTESFQSIKILRLAFAMAIAPSASMAADFSGRTT
jgi:hypothetical protein